MSPKPLKKAYKTVVVIWSVQDLTGNEFMDIAHAVDGGEDIQLAATNGKLVSTFVEDADHDMDAPDHWMWGDEDEEDDES